MSQPLLALVMIIKDEARGIRETLESIKPFIDRYTILDTGSTDGTQAIVREVMSGIEGALYQEPFVDFGTTRNRVLDLEGETSVFSLMLSGDETVVGGEALRAFLEARRQGNEGAFYVRVALGQVIYDSARVARTASKWRYVGVTHEVLGKEGQLPRERVAGAHIVHDISHRDEKSQTRRWVLDYQLLTAQLKRNPTDTRAAFYLAQTIECLGLHAQAHDAYKKRVSMGGFREEVYESLFRMARTAQKKGAPWAEVQQLYLDAYCHSVERAEPLFAIAWHWYEQKNWPLTYLFASRGASIPFPEKATLFVDSELYASKMLALVVASAQHVGEIDVGRAALEKALINRPDDTWLLAQRPFYDQRPFYEPR